MNSIGYGPQRPEPDNEYTKHPTPYYHNRFAVKMRSDLEKYFRLCAGKQFTLLRRVKEGGRCTTCTDAITGQILLDNCPECGGSGYSQGYSVVGKYWSIPEIGPEERMTGEFGNTESSGAARDTFVIVGAPLLRETDLVALTTTGIMYKVVDFEPRLTALNGEVITQVASLSNLTPGSKEYRWMPNE